MRTTTGDREIGFFDAGWFVEVQLITNDADGNPGGMSVAVSRDHRSFYSRSCRRS